jgi:hypothetical protein
MKRWMLAAGLAATACGSIAFGDVQLTIVTAQSSLTMGGSLNGTTLTAQGTGSNVTSYSGTMRITTPGSSFSFVHSDAAANDSGNWQPLVGGATGSAAANYGMRANLVIVIVNAAGRGMHLAFSGGPLTLTGSSFPMSSVTASIAQGTIDYNAGSFGTGGDTLVGLTAPAGTANGSLAVNGSTVTLTMPINSTLNSTVPTILGNLPVVVTLTGTVVATGTLPPQTGACCRGATCEVTVSADCPGQAGQQFLGVGSVCNAAGNHTSPCCNANFDQDASVGVQDIFAFLNAWFAGSASADVNGGGLAVQDIFDFLSVWFAGC